MTFEHVLKVFQAYLEKEDVYEVVLTKQGYTIMAWDNCLEEWYNVRRCETPERLMEELLDAFENYYEDRVTNSERDMTDDETQQMHKLANEFRTRCENESD